MKLPDGFRVPDRPAEEWQAVSCHLKKHPREFMQCILVGARPKREPIAHVIVPTTFGLLFSESTLMHVAHAIKTAATHSNTTTTKKSNKYDEAAAAVVGQILDYRLLKCAICFERLDCSDSDLYQVCIQLIASDTQYRVSSGLMCRRHQIVTRPELLPVCMCRVANFNSFLLGSGLVNQEGDAELCWREELSERWDNVTFSMKLEEIAQREETNIRVLIVGMDRINLRAKDFVKQLYEHERQCYMCGVAFKEAQEKYWCTGCGAVACCFYCDLFVFRTLHEPACRHVRRKEVLLTAHAYFVNQWSGDFGLLPVKELF